MVPGPPGVPGARYALNVSLTPGAGLLLPGGAAAVPGLFLPGHGVDVWDLLVTVGTKAGVDVLNCTQARQLDGALFVLFCFVLL